LYRLCRLKAGHQVSFSELFRWIQEVGFSGCRNKSGMTENFGVSSYKFFASTYSEMGSWYFLQSIPKIIGLLFPCIDRLLELLIHRNMFRGSSEIWRNHYFAWLEKLQPFGVETRKSPERPFPAKTLCNP
jgi:hypothetical protein